MFILSFKQIIVSESPKPMWLLFGNHFPFSTWLSTFQLLGFEFILGSVNSNSDGQRVRFKNQESSILDIFPRDFLSNLEISL